MEAAYEVAEDAIHESDLREVQLLWESIDHPWIRKIDRAKLAQDLDAIRRMDPHHILSGHLPPAPGRTATFLDTMAQSPDAAAYVGPDQAVLEMLLAQMKGSES